MSPEEAESSTSTGRGEAPLHSPKYRTSAKDPPLYGAQHRQDALWEGENETLPPMWQQFKTSLGGEIRYQDDTFMIASWNRPLPGVRLDYPGYLAVPGCEWHISPLGRSYFVDHNTRTTSWKKPKPKRPAGSLMPECVIVGHSQWIWSLAYLGASGNIMSTSEDSSIHQWKRDGEPVGNPLNSNGGGIISMVVSSDETMAIFGSADGRLRLWNIKEGSMVGEPWEGHDDVVRCLDWSRDSLEIASGSADGTIRRWNPNTGRQIAPPTETSHGWVYIVKYSPQGDKFISGGADNVIRMWSRNGKLLIEIKEHDNVVTSLCWSKDGTHIFSGSFDDTIRKWRANDGQELVVLRGHTNGVRSLCLTPNESYIVSASSDYSIRIWDLKTNQAVGDPLLHDDELLAVVMSPDGKHIVSAGLDKKIYVWSLEAALKVVAADDGNTKLKGHPTQPRVVQQPIAITKGSAKYGNDFFGNDPNRGPHHAAPSASPSFLHWRSLIGSLRSTALPTDTPRPSPRESRHWNFSLLPLRNSSRIVDVAPARDEDRYGIVPETDAEAAAAMQCTNSNQANSATHSIQPAGTQPSQVQPIQTQVQGSTGGAGDAVYEGVSCCGFFFGRRRSASHQS